MKIALVNYRYFFSGGPERYMFNIKEVLEKNGHTIMPFSIKHTKNLSTPYEKYFLEPIGSGKEVYAGEYKKNIKNSFRVLSRMLYSFEAKKKFKYFLKQEKPDIIYILYFQNKISCSIVDAASQMNIPVVQRISDFSLIAPCNGLYQNREKQICERCLKHSKWNAVWHKCIYESSLYSFLKVCALRIQDYRHLKEKIRGFVFPSSFTMQKFVEAGFPKQKLHHIPTLFNEGTLRKDLTVEYRPYALYIGRIVPEKGIKTLLEAFAGTEFQLKIIGFSDTNYQEEAERFLQGKKHRIEFLGKMDFNRIQEYLSKCLFTIIPSEWYDNLPNTILESYAFKKCIVATDIGSLSENIKENETGLLFPYKDSRRLLAQAEKLFDKPEYARKLGENGFRLVQTKYSINNHYRELIELFKDCTKQP